MMPDRARIEQLVPHAGAMCLLDAVTQWDAAQITCSSHEPGASHPLARDGVVPAIAAAEYAAQATAVHGALLDGAGQPRAGMLAKLMDVDLHSACFPPEGWFGDRQRHAAQSLGRWLPVCIRSRQPPAPSPAAA